MYMYTDLVAGCLFQPALSLSAFGCLLLPIASLLCQDGCNKQHASKPPVSSSQPVQPSQRGGGQYNRVDGEPPSQQPPGNRLRHLMRLLWCCSRAVVPVVRSYIARVCGSARAHLREPRVPEQALFKCLKPCSSGCGGGSSSQQNQGIIFTPSESRAPAALVWRAQKLRQIRVFQLGYMRSPSLVCSNETLTA